MDLMKTLMVYMVLVLSGASGADLPAVTAAPTAPAIIAEAALPSEAPAAETAAPSEMPQPTPVAYETLRNGSRGENVLKMQQRLSDLGYSISKLDGVFGRNTLAAVQAFQKDHGLKVDGVAGPKTLTVLYAAAAPTEAPTPTPLPEIEVPVMHMTEDGEMLYTGTAMVAEETAVSAGDSFTPEARYELVSEPVVTLRQENGLPVPAAAVFTYRDTQKDAQRPVEAGHTVKMGDEEWELTWYQDAQGAPWLSLTALAEKDGWEMHDNAFLTRASGTPISYTLDGDDCELTLDGVAVEDCARVWNGEVYVNAAFIGKLGGAMEADGETLVVRFEE